MKKLLIKEFTSESSAKKPAGRREMSGVGKVTRILAEKRHVSLDPKWVRGELARPEKFDLFVRPEVYLLGTSSPHLR